jgi:hypothetical protein
MAETRSNPSRHANRFTGPRRPRFTALTEARKDAELPAGEFELVHLASRPSRPARADKGAQNKR